MIDGALVLLGLAWFGLQDGRAQLEYNGGYVQTHRDDRDGVSNLAAPQRKPPSAYPHTPPSYSPDKDSGFPYPSHYPATASLTRSYYNPGAESESPVSSPAGREPFGISAKDFHEPLEISRDSSLYSPRKHSLEVVRLSQAPPTGGRPEAAVLIAHLPEDAVFWVEGTRTRSTGRTRYFQSPPLQPGRKYSYAVRVAWIEDGQWVSQNQEVPVQAGLIQAIYLRPRYDSSQYETRR